MMTAIDPKRTTENIMKFIFHRRLFSLLLIAAFAPGTSLGAVSASAWIYEDPTPFMKAARSGNLQEVKKLLSTNPSLLNESNANGASALLYALDNKQIAVANYLIDKGAIPTKCAEENMCPLLLAIRAGDFEVSKKLISLGASSKENPDFNAFELPMLHEAASQGRVDLLKLLVEHGAIIEFSQYYGEKTALSVAVRFGRTEAAKYLIDRGANIREPIERIYYGGKTALNYARENNYNETVELLESIKQQTAYTPKFTFDAILEKLYTDPRYLLSNEEGVRSILKSQSRTNLRLLRNVIFAKYNYRFDDPILIDFYQKRFKTYRPLTKHIRPTDIDSQNADFLRDIEEYAAGRDAAG